MLILDDGYSFYMGILDRGQGLSTDARLSPRRDTNC